MSDIGMEVASALANREADDIDWITFVGSGETTLASRLGSMVRFVKTLTDLPVAVITNGSLLNQPRVRADLLAADAVLPSLDVGTERLFRAINRPPRDLSLRQHVEGLVKFRRMFQGKLWVEVMLLGGVNDTSDALHDTAVALESVQPDEIHLTTPSRPPAETWVQPPSDEGLERANLILGQIATVVNPVAVSGVPAIDGDLVDALLSIIQRHPMHEGEVEHLVHRWLQQRVDSALSGLAECGKAQLVERFGHRYWCASGLDYSSRREPHTRRPAQTHSPAAGVEASV
jgi:wyosine [tRNA(Phe)-imidazoG37] synthetase (radical SAM superfamily)